MPNRFEIETMESLEATLEDAGFAVELLEASEVGRERGGEAKFLSIVHVLI